MDQEVQTKEQREDFRKCLPIIKCGLLFWLLLMVTISVVAACFSFAEYVEEFDHDVFMVLGKERMIEMSSVELTSEIKKISPHFIRDISLVVRSSGYLNYLGSFGERDVRYIFLSRPTGTWMNLEGKSFSGIENAIVAIVFLPDYDTPIALIHNGEEFLFADRG